MYALLGEKRAQCSDWRTRLPKMLENVVSLNLKRYKTLYLGILTHNAQNLSCALFCTL